MMKKYRLDFPKDVRREPLLFSLIKNFGIKFNILEGKISKEETWLIIKLEGPSAALEASLDYLLKKNVSIQPLANRS